MLLEYMALPAQPTMQPRVSAQAAAGDVGGQSSQNSVPGASVRGSADDMHTPSPQQKRTREQVLRCRWGGSGEPSAPVKGKSSRRGAWADLASDSESDKSADGTETSLEPLAPRRLFADM